MAETKKPTAKQIDAAIAEFDTLQRAIAEQRATVATLQEQADGRKVQILAWIAEFGFDHTEKSRRLAGLHNKATATTGTLVQIDDEACDAFRGYIEENLPSGVAGRFFTARTVYQMVKGPDEVLRTLDLKPKMRTRMEDLVRKCFRVTTKAPSLKVDVAGVGNAS